MITRSPRNSQYSIIDTSISRDKRLSYTAIGLYAYLCSMPYEVATREYLYETRKDSKKEIDAALKELVSLGYIDEVQP